jgi:hypothetical protein
VAQSPGTTNQKSCPYLPESAVDRSKPEWRQSARP